MYINIEESLDFIEVLESDNLVIDYQNCSFFFVYEIEDLNIIFSKAFTQKSRLDLWQHRNYFEWLRFIALSECIAYLEHRSHLNSLSPSIKEKMLNLLKLCLEDYSVSEVWNLIWRAVESASAFVQKPNITRKHASNSIYGNISRELEKVKIGKTKMLSFSRVKEVPQTAISIVMIDIICCALDSGFNKPISSILFAQTTNENEINNYRKLGTTYSQKATCKYLPDLKNHYLKVLSV